MPQRLAAVAFALGGMLAPAPAHATPEKSRVIQHQKAAFKVIADNSIQCLPGTLEKKTYLPRHTRLELGLVPSLIEGEFPTNVYDLRASAGEGDECPAFAHLYGRPHPGFVSGTVVRTVSRIWRLNTAGRCFETLHEHLEATLDGETLVFVGDSYFEVGFVPRRRCRH